MNYINKIANCRTVLELKELVMDFDKCELKSGAKNTVFSDGNSVAKIMIIGEAPGFHEDINGIPFCGRSGKLLDNMLNSIGLDRNKVYITNTVFWRPPANRKPTEEETSLCLPFVEKHIALVNPKLLILVGNTAAVTVLQTEDKISNLRGKFFNYKNSYMCEAINVTIMFHPAFLLRRQDKKIMAWEDLKKVKNFLLSKITVI